MFKAIWAARWYVLLGFFTFVIVLAVNTPLHFVWGYVKPQLGRLPVQVDQITGTVWDGSARLRVPRLNSLGPLDARWQLSPVGLLGGQADLDVHLSGNGVRLDSAASVGLNQVLTLSDASGYLDAAVIAPLLKRNRVNIAGSFELSQLNTTLDTSAGNIRALSGRLVYSGGAIGFPVNNKPVSATMPVVVGVLGMDGDKAVIYAATTDNLPLMQGYMQADGWGGVSIRRRFLDVLGQQWPNPAEEDTVIFEVSHKVL